MITIEQLEAEVVDKSDADYIELTKHLCREPFGAVVTLTPGIRGKVIDHDGPNAIVRVKVRQVRHFLRMVNA